MEEQVQALKDRLWEVNDLRMAASLLHWDQATYMPPGGAEARSRQIATLSRLAHEKFTDERVGLLLEKLKPYEDGLSPDSDEASLIRLARKDYAKALQVPPRYTAEFIRHVTRGFSIWAQARPQSDFQAVRPVLERTLDLSRQYAEFFPGYEHIADPLIDDSDEGMTAAAVKELFSKLREGLVPLVQKIAEQPPVDDGCLRQHFPEGQQKEFGLKVIRAFGYDFTRGRQDKTHHPFMTKFCLGDVRITTRFDEKNLAEGLFSTLHESGHAMYEQGIDRSYEGTPLARGTSSGVHESQSRLWENLVGRSRRFWSFFYPELQKAFPEQLGSVDEEAFYRAVNKVQRSLIRTDADEVTYNLHVLIRFDLELELLEGKLKVQDLPEAWNARYQADLGLTPPDLKDGVLQDVHWYSGHIGGAFQGYTLGNIMSAQIFDAALQDHPDILAEIERGRFKTLHAWLRENLYQHGRKYTADELVRRATGAPVALEPYFRYLKEKFGQLYAL